MIYLARAYQLRQLVQPLLRAILNLSKQIHLPVPLKKTKKVHTLMVGGGGTGCEEEGPGDPVDGNLRAL